MDGAHRGCFERPWRGGGDAAGGGGGDGYTGQGAREQWGVVEGLGVNFNERVLMGLLRVAGACICLMHGS